MEPQWNSSFQHPAPLCRHAPRSSFRIFSPPDIHPSTLHDCEDQHSSLHAHCLPPSSRTFPNGSSDVRNGPLPHCVPSLYLLPCFSISSSIFQTLAMATVTEVISTGFSNAMVRVFPFETFPTISELFHSENHFHHLPLNNVRRLLIVVCSSFSSWSQYGCVRLVFLLLLTSFTFFWYRFLFQFPYLISMFVCLFGAIATSFLPETLGAELPDTVKVNSTNLASSRFWRMFFFLIFQMLSFRTPTTLVGLTDTYPSNHQDNNMQHKRERENMFWPLLKWLEGYYSVFAASEEEKIFLGGRECETLVVFWGDICWSRRLNISWGWMCFLSYRSQ